MSKLANVAESLSAEGLSAIAAHHASTHLIDAAATAEKESAMQRLTESAPRTEPETITHYGTERDYLLHRLNLNYQHRTDPGMADYVGVRKTGMWEVEA